jgi:hypothetical protein
MILKCCRTMHHVLCIAQVMDVDEATVGEALAMMTRTAEGLRPNNGTQVSQPSARTTRQPLFPALTVAHCLVTRACVARHINGSSHGFRQGNGKHYSPP